MAACTTRVVVLFVAMVSTAATSNTEQVPAILASSSSSSSSSISFLPLSDAKAGDQAPNQVAASPTCGTRCRRGARAGGYGWAGPVGPGSVTTTPQKEAFKVPTDAEIGGETTSSTTTTTTTTSTDVPEAEEQDAASVPVSATTPPPSSTTVHNGGDNGNNSTVPPTTVESYARLNATSTVGVVILSTTSTPEVVTATTTVPSSVSCMDMSTTNFMHNYVRVSCERIGEGGHCNHPEFAAKINEECPMTCGRCRTDTCSFSRDGVCDEPYLCAQGTDCTDCGNCEERLTDENLIPKQGEAVRISMATKARY